MDDASFPNGYSSALDYAIERAVELKELGRLAGSPGATGLLLALRPRFRRTQYGIVMEVDPHDPALIVLAGASKKDAPTRELARGVIKGFICRGEPVPEPLRDLSVRLIDGVFKPAKKSQWWRDLTIIFLMSDLCDGFGLHPLHNEDRSLHSNAPPSAAQIVSEAFTACGIPVTPRATKRVWENKEKTACADQLGRMFQILQGLPPASTHLTEVLKGRQEKRTKKQP